MRTRLSPKYLFIAGAILALASLIVLASCGGSATPSTPSPTPPFSQPSSATSTQPSPSKATSATLTLPSAPVLQNGDVRLSGEGFAPNEAVVIQTADVLSGTIKEIGRSSADAKGQVVSSTITLPEWVTSGTYKVEAIGATSGRKADGTLKVRAKQVWLNPKEYAFKLTDKIGFVAGGFEPGEKVRVFLTEGQAIPDQHNLPAQPITTVTTDEAGNLAWTEFPISSVDPGTYSLLLSSADGQRQINAVLRIDPLEPFFELSPWSGLPGRKVNIDAQGFLPGENVDVYVGGTDKPVTSLQADKNGELWGAGPITIPYGSNGGPLQVTLIGQSSKTKAVTTFGVVQANPWLELSEYSGAPGAAVTFSGGGFYAGEKITIHLGDSSGPMVGAATTDLNGVYSKAGLATIPGDAKQDVTFTAVGEISHLSATAKFSLVLPYVPTPLQ